MKKWILLPALVTAVVMLTGCERKITDEAQTVIDDDGALLNCFGCHDGASGLGIEVVLATRQWENSKHGSGDNIGRNSGSCRGCHTSEGFISRVTSEDVTDDHYTAIGCFTCHDPHGNGDFRLRITDPVTLENGATYDRGVSNLCVQCHHGRRDVETYVFDGVELSNHFGPHHSNQSDMLLGENAYEYDGYDYDDNSWHTTAAAEGCVKCHFRVSNSYVLGGHSFQMESEDEEDEEENTAACNVDGCHINENEIDDFDRPAAEDFDGNGETEGVQTEIEGLMEELEGLLIDAGLLEFVEEADAWEPTEDLVVPDADSAGAVFNWSFVHEDKSHGIHNTRYAVALLKSSINYMTTGDPNGSPPSGRISMRPSH